MGLLSSTLTLALLGGVGARVSRRASHARAIADTGRKGETKRDSFWLAATPYVLLTVFLLVSRLVPPLRVWLQTHAVLELPAVQLSLPLLYLPGFWVLLALLITICMRGTPRHMARDVLGAAWRQFMPSALAILLFLREIPGHAGQCHDGLAGSRCGCSGQPVCVDLALVSRSGRLVDRF